MTNPELQHLRIDRSAGIGTLTLNRPQALNALSVALLGELRRALEALAQDTEVKVLILTAAGRGFCAGADLHDLLDRLEHKAPDERSGDVIASMMYSLHNRVIERLWNFPKPVICAVNGIAAGGGLGLALTSDLVIAARSARFASVFARQLGIAPDMGTSFHLQRLVGRARALRLALLGEQLGADAALEWGLIAEVCDDQDLMSRAMHVARQLTEQEAEVFVRTREGLRKAEQTDMSGQLSWEAEAQRELCSRPAFDAQVRAFAENSRLRKGPLAKA